MVEMLVVIGILVVISLLVTPTIFNAYRQGERAAMSSDLRAISIALEEYKRDHGDYPRVAQTPGAPGGGMPAFVDPPPPGQPPPPPPPWPDRPNPPSGSQILCRALIGPADATEVAPKLGADGKDGPGFRTRPGGKPYGPYLRPEQFRAGHPYDDDTQNTLQYCLLDRRGKPILYYPANPGPPIVTGRVANPGGNPGQVPAYIGPSEYSLYDQRDNTTFISTNSLCRMLGDRDFTGELETTALVPERPAYTGPYILWSAGPDEKFYFTDVQAYPPNANAAAVAREVAASDDVTNFR